MVKGQFKQTNKVVTEPLARVSMTILLFIGDTTKFNLTRQYERMCHTLINDNNQRDTINKICTSNQIILFRYLHTTKRKHFPTSSRDMWGFPRLLALGTDVTWFSTVKISQNCTLVIRGMMSLFSTLETCQACALPLRDTMT